LVLLNLEVLRQNLAPVAGSVSSYLWTTSYNLEVYARPKRAPSHIACGLIDLWIQARIRTDEQRSVIANGVDHMPTGTFQHADKHVEADVGERMYDVAERAEGGIPFACKAGACGICATRVLENIDSLGRVSAREARTLTNLDLNPEIFRLTCLANVGRGDIVWGQPNNAPEANQTLGTYGVRVESYRPLNLTVAEVRFYVQAEDFSFTPG
jgi:ferredoxin